MNQNVLIIDDSAVDRIIMSRIIQKQIPDVTIYEADGEIDVNAVIYEKEINVCILDLRMPNKDGYTILKEIKSDKRIMDVPVIVCSGVLDTDSLVQVLTMGAYDYFSKPLSEEVMKVALPLKVRNAIDFMKRTQHILHLSQTDPLTGLYNRSYFKRYLLEYDIDDVQPISVLMADINGLKISNDAYGSEFGDQFLIEAAQIMQSILPQNAVSSRWGGDEFVALVPNCSKEKAEAYAMAMETEFLKVNKRGLRLSLAVGWDTTQYDVQDLAKILINAEDVMIRSKIFEDVSVRSNTIATILHTLHEKNPREEAHSRRVSELCQKIGQALQLSEKEQRDLKVIGLLHDIGKIAIDEKILNKPGHLEHEEWLELKRHPEISYRILSASPELYEYSEIILCHHERPDGKGYPNGIKEDEIPYFSKILSIADSYDAMTRERTYKRTMTDEEAAMEFLKHRGTQFDKALIDVFISKVLNLPIQQ